MAILFHKYVSALPDPLDADSVYYVRALQEPTPALNGDPLRCIRDERGRCIEARPCLSPTSDDECTAEIQERAWSSPIFVRPPTGG